MSEPSCVQQLNAEERWPRVGELVANLEKELPAPMTKPKWQGLPPPPTPPPATGAPPAPSGDSAVSDPPTPAATGAPPAPSGDSAVCDPPTPAATGAPPAPSGNSAVSYPPAPAAAGAAPAAPADAAAQASAIYTAPKAPPPWRCMPSPPPGLTPPFELVGGHAPPSPRESELGLGACAAGYYEGGHLPRRDYLSQQPPQQPLNDTGVRARLAAIVSTAAENSRRTLDGASDLELLMTFAGGVLGGGLSGLHSKSRPTQPQAGLATPTQPEPVDTHSARRPTQPQAGLATPAQPEPVDTHSARAGSSRDDPAAADGRTPTWRGWRNDEKGWEDWGPADGWKHDDRQRRAPESQHPQAENPWTGMDATVKGGDGEPIEISFNAVPVNAAGLVVTSAVDEDGNPIKLLVDSSGHVLNEDGKRCDMQGRVTRPRGARGGSNARGGSGARCGSHAGGDANANGTRSGLI